MAIGEEINHLNQIAIDAVRNKGPAPAGLSLALAGVGCGVMDGWGRGDASVCSAKAPGKHPAALGILPKSSPLPSLPGWDLFLRSWEGHNFEMWPFGGLCELQGPRGLSGSSAPDIEAPPSL